MNNPTWRGSTDPADKGGVAVFAAGKRTATVRLESFDDYMALLAVIEAARLSALDAQAMFLRGAINRIFDQR